MNLYKKYRYRCDEVNYRQIFVLQVYDKCQTDRNLVRSLTTESDPVIMNPQLPAEVFINQIRA